MTIPSDLPANTDREVTLHRARQADREGRLSAANSMAAMLAHEIRNPLGSMELFAGLLRREIAGDDDALSLLDRLTSGIAAINNVVANYLVFTKELKPARIRFDAIPLLADAMALARAPLDAQGVSVTVTLPDEPRFILGDRELLRQAVLNLVRNGAQAMPDGGSFSLTTRTAVDESGRRLEIIVADTGPGVPPEVRDKVFDPFFTTKESGAGLGLAIVSQVAGVHGGWADLLPTDTGASFVLALPLAPDEPDV